jgi:hypothetical protein
VVKKNTEYLDVAYGNLGHIYLFEKNYAKSMEYYQKCVLLFDDIDDFEAKFDLDLKFALEHGVTKNEYNKTKNELVLYWEDKK